jgi:hypothetical protein
MTYCLYTINYIHGKGKILITHNIESVIHKNSNSNKESNRSVALQTYAAEKKPLWFLLASACFILSHATLLIMATLIVIATSVIEYIIRTMNWLILVRF